MSNHLRFSDYCLAHRNGGIGVTTDKRREEADVMDLRDVVKNRVGDAIMTSSNLAALRELGDAKTGSYAYKLTVRASDLADDVWRKAVRSGVEEALKESGHFKTAPEQGEAADVIMEVIALRTARIAHMAQSAEEGRLADGVTEALQAGWQPAAK